MANKWDNYGGILHNTDAINDTNIINNMVGQRMSARLGDKFSLDYSYSIVGMDATKVSSAIQAINDYVQRVENMARQINEGADMNVALKNDAIQAAVRNYIEKVEEYCANLCSQLKLFRDRLQEADAAWRAHAEALSQTISADTASFDAGTHRE